MAVGPSFPGDHDGSEGLGRVIELLAGLAGQSAAGPGQRGEARSAAIAERILYRCLENGLSFKLGAGNVITLCPPLTISPADLDRALDIPDAAVATAA